MTHDKHGIDAIPCDELSEKLQNDLEKYSIVGIDEAQFLRGLVSFANRLADQGKIVIIAGCDATFLLNPFGELCQLVATAESVVKLTSVCKECMEDASFTKRITNETAEEVIGGEETYVPICRSCNKTNLAASEGMPQETAKSENRKRKDVTENNSTKQDKTEKKSIPKRSIKKRWALKRKKL